MCSSSAPSLSDVEVVVVDCQATAAAPRGHLLEIGWAHVGKDVRDTQASLIALPEGAHIPPAVARLTGISHTMLRDGVRAHVAWRELLDHAAKLPQQPAPTVVHFARFEQPFLHALAGGEPPLDLVCTHAIARRLLPGLPRCTLRALTGYFGRAVGQLRRSAEHVEATAFVWRELVRLLEADGISTWSALHDWLALPDPAAKRRRRMWPMPRDLRLSLPDQPGVYRMLRTSGDVVYVGKASSLHHRVNSYFRKQHGVPERLLEMLSQVRGVSFEVTPTALEAALLECDEVKRHEPPYNIALQMHGRALWFASSDLSERSSRRSARCRFGPFPTTEVLDQFAAFAGRQRAALGRGRWGPDEATFSAGYMRLCALHPELSRDDLSAHARLLRLGTRLWKEGRRDSEADDDTLFDRDREAVWIPEYVQASLERLALRAALARRRAKWFTRLFDSTLVWNEPGASVARLLVIENGEITVGAATAFGAQPPIPNGWRRPVAARHEAFTVARFDRLRALTTELKRLTATNASVRLRWSVAPALADGRLARALSWV